MNKTTEALKVAEIEDLQDSVTKALKKAFQLGQTYWQQADSESFSQNKKADETQAKFYELEDETVAAIREALAEPVNTRRCSEYSEVEYSEQVKQEPVAWIYEDELPEHYPYEEMFNASTIIDGVRMFPNVKMLDRSMFYGLTKDHTWLSVTESQFNKLKPEARMKCYLAPVSAEAIRAEALEEAAKVCEDYSETLHQWTDKRKVFAAAIRSLK